ncbi:beta-ketoacyl synthase N-terminal-like domain-containing protein, partial [Streptomyces sp. DH12]|uniref:beta-ketoacyl synthase N-terminal-like domain-containing protein n=1 Tax=Streptomyces sp. DH12 TaxID=2857010 RepID=UPI001E65D1CF
LYLTELPHVFMSRAGMLSPTGRCRPFDAAADGIVPGEGCAVVVLKPLKKALADGDPVHAVVRASGIGQDGRTNGITAPSAASQARLVTATLVLRLTGDDVAALDAARKVLAAHRTQPLTLIAVTADPRRADAARALVQTLRQENPRLTGRALLVGDDGPAAAPHIRAELAAP